MSKKLNIQDSFLNYVRKNRISVKIFLVNGVEILNYKSNDTIFYGSIQNVDVTSAAGDVADAGDADVDADVTAGCC